MRVLVTGANGFIGNYIMDYLAFHNVDTVGISKHNDKNPAIVCCDLAEDIFLDGEFDCIVHTAAQNPTAAANMQSYLRNNVAATQNIISYAKRKHIKKFINMSAVSMFGEVQDSKLNEETKICNPSNYGISKYIAERILMEENEMDICSLILPGVLGCASNGSPWLRTVAMKMVANEKISYFNGDALFNNLLYVEDLAKYVLYIIENPSIFRGWNRFLLGSRQSLPISEILMIMKELLGSESELCCVKSNQAHFSLDITKALNNGFVSRDIVEILHTFAKDIKAEIK